MQVRLAKPTDAKVIYKFVCELEDTLFDFSTFEKLFLKNIAHPDYFYLIGCINNIPIGYVSCHVQILLHHCGLVGEIQELFIAPPYRNKGVGQVLIDKVEKIAQKDNWANLEVTCNKKRVDTHRFYRRLDFLDTHLKFVKQIK